MAQTQHVSQIQPEADEQLLPETLPEQSGFWAAVKADAIANGGFFSSRGLLKLLLLHSGFQLLFLFRVQKWVRQFGAIGRFVADVLLKIATDLTSCHIYRDATLEGGIHIPHATGIVIGAGVIVRQDATIYQNVTLGRGKNDAWEYPELCEGCTVFAGAVVIGNIRIGKNAVVGANSVVLKSVPDQAVAVGVPARIIEK